MGKPRIFVGSSVEGLAVANALHLNLMHQMEVTVWPQGIFRPTASALESLLNNLDEQDFGAFIFQPDDLVTVRGEDAQTVRDNVLFELGLYIGRLGPSRAFFLMPAGGQRLRLASDLIGIQPLLYEWDRSDGNWQAATGPAGAQITQQATRLGARARSQRAEPGEPSTPRQDATAFGSPNDPVQITDDATTTSAPPEGQLVDQSADRESDWEWFDAYYKGDYQRAIELLYKLLERAPEKAKDLNARAWIGRSRFQIDPVAGERELLDVIDSNPDRPDAYIHLTYALTSTGANARALEVSEKGVNSTGQHEDFPGMVVARVEALKGVGRANEAIPLIISAIDTHLTSAELYIAVAELLEKAGNNDRARYWLDVGIQRAPKSKRLLKKYASFLTAHDDSKLALVLYNAMLVMEPNDPEALTLRANEYLDHDCFSTALRDYRNADEQAKGEQSWILANIGNILNNRGFYDEAIQYFQRAIKIDSESHYAHERLARALQRRDEEITQVKKAHEAAADELAKWRQEHPLEPEAHPLSDTDRES